MDDPKQVEEIRQRLASVAGIDWTEIKREVDEDYYGDWVKVGPVLLPTVDPDEVLQAAWSEERRAKERQEILDDNRQLELTVEFLRHAAGDIGALLEENNRQRALLTEAADVLKDLAKACIVVSPTLDKPYPDEPRLTPWTKFVKKPASRAYDLGVEIRRRLAS